MNPSSLTEAWFIPIDILNIVSTTLIITLSVIFLFIIIVDKTCHTVPMMLTANSCFSGFLAGCILLNLSIFTFQNDLKQIEYEDSLCIFRGYITYVGCGAFNYSFLLQAIYRYVIIIYPNRLPYQSVKVQVLLICSTWIFAIVFPIAFLFTGDILYNVQSQICQVPVRLSYSMIHIALCIYVIPVNMIMLIYFILIRYVKGMGKRVTPMNILARARRELRMVRRTVIQVTILVTVGLPYALFIFMSFFTKPPIYHYRIAFIFIDLSTALVMIVLFQFTDPLKASVKKRIHRRRNTVVVATVA